MDYRCPECNGETRKYGTVKRKVKTKNGAEEWIAVQRYQCKSCNKIHRLLPDGVMRLKQYEEEVIRGVQEGLIDSGVLGFEDYPCEMTMRRWRKDAQK